MIRTRIASHGFTLIELLMTLAIVVILMCLSLPSMATLLSSTQARASSQDLATALNAARTSAVNGNGKTVVCPSSNQRDCTGGLRWDGGWIAFNDRNDNGSRDADEPLIAAASALLRGVAIASTVGRDHVTFRPDGSSAGSNVTFTICDKRGSAAATSIVINNPGRIRSGRPTAEAAAATCALLAR